MLPYLFFLRTKQGVNELTWQPQARAGAMRVRQLGRSPGPKCQSTRQGNTGRRIGAAEAPMRGHVAQIDGGCRVARVVGGFLATPPHHRLVSKLTLLFARSPLQLCFFCMMRRD